MAAKSVAFINFKGGVGKTAMTVNLAACLAYFRGKRVLVVDLDPQCNASFWLLPPKAWREHVSGGQNSTYQIFDDQIVGKHQFDFDKAVVRGVPRKELPLIAELDLLPAAVELLTIEDKIYQNKYARFFEFLHKTLKDPIKANKYDYVFYDCPPNTYAVTKNALYAADYCVVPFVPDFLSLSGFQILAQQVEAFADRISGFRQGRPRASIAAVAISHYRTINAFDHGLEELRNTLASLKVRNLVRTSCSVLEPYVRLSADVSASTGEHLPVCLHKPDGNGAHDYYNLALALEQHLEQL